MADTLKDGLLLGGGICHVTATSQFTCGSKQVPACVLNIESESESESLSVGRAAVLETAPSPPHDH